MKQKTPQAIVRAQARNALKKKYAKAVTAFVVALLPIYIIEGASTVIICVIESLSFDKIFEDMLVMLCAYPVMTVIGVLLSPLVNGYIRCFYMNALNGDFDLNDLFYYLSKGRYARTLKLDLSFVIRLIIPGALFFIPVIVYAAVCKSFFNDFNSTLIYRDFLFILIVLSSIMLTLYSLKYFTVFTIYCEREYMSSKELFAASKSVMRGQSSNAAKLIFSYTPWMLLCFTVLPMLYVVPYMTQGLCVGAKWMTRAADTRQAL